MSGVSALVSVLVSVGVSFCFATVRGAASGEYHRSRVSIGDYRYRAFWCATVLKRQIPILNLETRVRFPVPLPIVRSAQFLLEFRFLPRPTVSRGRLWFFRGGSD